MFRVYSNESSILVNHIKNILETNGISSQIKNEAMQGIGIGELGMCWPELWLKDTSQQFEAEELIKQALSNTNKLESDWVCKTCAEENEGNFQICWQCMNVKE